MPASKGDKVRVAENGGEYLARITSTDRHEDPNGNKLYGVKVLEIIQQPSYDLNEGETCNVYPAEVTPE